MSDIKVEEVLGVELETIVDERGSGKRNFTIRGAQTPEAAHAAFIDHVLAFYPIMNGLTAKRFRLTESPEHGNILYTAEVEYKIDKKDNNGNNTDPEDPDNEFTLPTFSLRGGTKKVVRPYSLIARVVQEGAQKVDYKLIGWNGEEYTGTEVDAGNLEFMLPQLIQVSEVTFTLVNELNELVGCVNNVPFYGLSRGECKYLGPEQSYKTLSMGRDAEGNEQYMRFVELQHHFKCQPNLKKIKIGNCPEVDIPGWACVDVHYRKELHDIGDGKLTELAMAVQVDIWQDCPWVDFRSKLGI